MPDIIKPNRLVLDDRFSVMGFTLRFDKCPKWFEVALATDPKLFQPEAKSRRTSANFYSSRGEGVLEAVRGESVYLVPPGAVQNSIGQQKVYYGLATFSDPSRAQLDSLSVPTEGSPWIDVKSFTGRSLRRVGGGPARQGGNGYGAGGGPAL